MSMYIWPGEKHPLRLFSRTTFSPVMEFDITEYGRSRAVSSEIVVRGTKRLHITRQGRRVIARHIRGNAHNHTIPNLALAENSKHDTSSAVGAVGYVQPMYDGPAFNSVNGRARACETFNSPRTGNIVHGQNMLR